MMARIYPAPVARRAAQRGQLLTNAAIVASASNAAVAGEIVATVTEAAEDIAEAVDAVTETVTEIGLELVALDERLDDLEALP
jgi:vacuolar-type H+-ATPase catalytic subunit A/Vma1